MGDWYANAEFCLVHLDTNWRASDAVHDWKMFKEEEATQLVANIASFKAINDSSPEWPNRAWMLQELVMSKMAFFVKSEWEPLSRPVESLGHIYPLIPFIEFYVRGDMANMYRKSLETEESRRATLCGITESVTLGAVLERGEAQVVDGDDRNHVASERVKKAIRLILILRGLGFRFPNGITTEIAISEMTQSVCLAAWNLAREENDCSNAAGRELSKCSRVTTSPARLGQSI